MKLKWSQSTNWIKILFKSGFFLLNIVHWTGQDFSEVLLLLKVLRKVFDRYCILRLLKMFQRSNISQSF